jgi:hypothetical protein
LLEVERRSKIKIYINTPIEILRSTENWIYFEPRTKDEMDSYIDLLTDELLLRRINPVGDLESLRECLLHEIELEHKLQQHLKKLEHCSKLEQCLTILLHKIPCILHLENRVGLKLLPMLLKEGFDNIKEGFFFGQGRRQSES